VKSALTHCNKLLKKYPPPSAPGIAATASPTTVPRQLLTALKILALVRANKLDEASTLTNNLLAETPIDETVLTTLAHSLKPLDRPKELVGMWVGAWGRASKEAEEAKKKMAKGGKGAKTAASEAELEKLLQHSEELGAQAFMAMVRTGHWAMAQSTAFKLYRAFAPPKGQENPNGPGMAITLFREALID
jgi:N-terminal acetyltransferase B complex non-catalytic subunit